VDHLEGKVFRFAYENNYGEALIIYFSFWKKFKYN